MSEKQTRRRIIVSLVVLTMFVLLSFCLLVILVCFFLLGKSSFNQKEQSYFSEIFVENYQNAYNAELNSRLIGYIVVRAYDQDLVFSLLKAARKVEKAKEKDSHHYQEAHIALNEATDMFRTDEYRGSVPAFLFQSMQISMEENVFRKKIAAADVARVLLKDTLECKSAESDKFFARTKLIQLLSSSVSSSRQNAVEIKKLVEENRSAAASLDKESNQTHPFLLIQRHQEAEVLEGQGLIKESLALLEQTSKLAESRKLEEIDQEMLRVSLLRAYTRQHELEKALALAESLTVSRPDCSYYFAHKALLEMCLKQLDASEADYRKALSLEEPPSWTREYFVGLLVMQKKYDAALSECQGLFEQAKPAAKSYWIRGAIYEKMNRKVEAETDLKEAIRLAPDPCTRELVRSHYCLSRNKPNKALEVLNRALSLTDTVTSESDFENDRDSHALKGYLYAMRASTYKALGRNKEADADMKAAQAFDNGDLKEFLRLYQP